MTKGCAWGNFFEKKFPQTPSKNFILGGLTKYMQSVRTCNSVSRTADLYFLALHPTPSSLLVKGF